MTLKQYKKFGLSVFLFALVFCLIGLPFSNWWFNGDDFSALAIAVYAKNGWFSLIDCFLNGNIWQYFYPSHHQYYCLPNDLAPFHFSCFSFYYRPLYCVYFIIGYWLFGLSGYYFFLANAFFHALNTTILFNIFSYFSASIPALLAALAFAFHPQIGFRYGSIANLHYYIDLTLILLLCILLKKFLDTKKRLFHVASCCLFLLSLFTRETSIMLPLIIFFGSYLYQQQKADYSMKNFGNNLLNSIYTTSGYLFCAIFYLGLRLYLYPIHNTTTEQAGFIKFVITWLNTLPSRTQEFFVFLYDYLGISWLPWGVLWFKVVILVPLIALLLWLFAKNTKKLIVLFFVFATIVMLWPAVYINYSARYFYEAYPCILLTFITLCTFSRISSSKKKAGLFFITLFCIFNAVLVLQNLQCREKKLSILKNAFLELKNDQRITTGNRPLLFSAFPIDGLGTGIEQATWLFATPPNNPIYYDPSSMLTQADSNILEHAGWYMRCAQYYTKNYFTITRTKNDIRLTSTNPQKIHFSLQNDYLSLGKKTILQTALVKNQKVVTDFTITLDQKYLNQKPLIIAWNYEQEKFIIYE